LGREARASPALARLAPDPVAAPAADRVAPTVRPEHFIRPGAAVDLVLAGPTDQGVFASVAFQPILSRSAAYQIAVWPAKGDVAASVPALHDVVASARLKCVRGCLPGEQIVALGAYQGVFRIAAD
jgi:hypothetical protein